MNRIANLEKSARLVVGVLLGALTLVPQTVPETAKSAIERGSKAWKEHRYDEAEAAFNLAAKLDPKDPSPLLFIGSMLMWQPVPFTDTKTRLEKDKRAEAALRAAIAIQPSLSSYRVLASMLFNERMMLDEPERTEYRDKAEAVFRQILQLDSNDKNALSSLGWIAFDKVNPAVKAARASLKIKDTDPGPLPDAAVRTSLQTRFGPVVDKGMDYLRRAVELSPNADDARSHLILLLRLRADLATDAAGYQRDTAEANQLEAEMKEIRAQRNEAENHPPFGSYTRPGSWMAADAPRVHLDPADEATRLERKPEAVYPEKAGQAEVKGSVRFAVTIDLAGQVESAHLLSGDPRLVPAALEALKKYHYKSYFLNGHGTRVDTEVKVQVVP